MFDPSKTTGAGAILDARVLVREFLFEGNVDHLLEIGAELSASQCADLVEVVNAMPDSEVHAWATWLMQVTPEDGAQIICTHMLDGVLP